MTGTFDYVVTTGDHIAEWIEDTGINAAELARRLNVTPKHVSELLSGKAPLSHAVALDLETVTGIPARIWNLYESNYRSRLAHLTAETVLAEQYEQAKSFPLPYLRKWGHITASHRDKAGTVRDLLPLLSIASLEAFDATWVHGKVAYRKLAVTGDKAPALATWLALGEKEAKVHSPSDSFDRDALEAALPELRALTALDDQLEAIESAQDVLASVGVAFVLLPPVPGLGVHGATRWVDDRPLIQLSLRGKSDDQLWFTLFHEIGHVLLHGDKSVFLNTNSDSTEEEADNFAATTLVPAAFRDRLPRTRDLEAIQTLAKELGIAPSIVLGQAQRITGDFKWGHSLKRKFEWAARSNLEKPPNAN